MAPTDTKQQQQDGKAPLAPWAFQVGVLPTENASDYNNSAVMTAAAKRLPDVRVEPDGWLRGIWVDFTMVTAANAAAVAYVEDGPWSAIDTVLFKDTGGEQIFGPFGGYDWMTVNKFGGYHAQGDPRQDPNFTAITGAGGTGGSFHFVLYLPLEITKADSFGAVENRSENSIYRIELTMAASTAVYSVAPTTLGTMTVVTTQDAYTEPVAAMALSGRPVSSAPPAAGSLQYWKQEYATLSAGVQSALITNGLGHGHREIIFKLSRANTSRANGDADWPNPLEVTLGTTRLRNLYKDAWITKMARDFELRSATADTAGGRENGVYPLWFNKDMGIKPGNDARRGTLRTKTGNTFKVRGSFGTAGTLYITSNYLVPRGNDFSQVVA